MLNIAICDDNAADLSAERACLEDYFRAHPDLSGQVRAFPSGEALLEAVRETGGFDLYILDVIMPGLSGVQSGMVLRELGEEGEIIYLTASNDYAAESYDTAAFFYLLKPAEKERLFAVLDRALDRRARREAASVMVRTPHGLQRLLLERLLYAERVGRIMRYYCEDCVVDSSSLRCSLQEAAAPLLADRRFALCGVSFVFNLRHVKGVEGHAVLLDTGTRVTIPSRAAPGFKNVWGKYWLEDTRR